MNTIIDIIIVNWNSGALTVKAIQPYLYNGDIGFRYNIIVVDNASSDNSIELLSIKGIKLIKNEENYGFGYACNQAIKECLGEYVLLLNPDTLSSTQTLQTLAGFLEKNKEYGIVGPRQIDENNKTIRTCGRFPGFFTSLYEVFGLSKLAPRFFTPVPIMIDWEHDQSADVDHVMGSYMLIRRSIIDKIGFMDEDYFLYFEDIDLSKRIANRGYKTRYNVDEVIFHACGGSGYFEKKSRLFYVLTARQTYWKKHLKKTWLLLTILSLIIEPFPRILNAFIKTRSFQLRAIIPAYYLYLKKIFLPR